MANTSITPAKGTGTYTGNLASRVIGTILKPTIGALTVAGVATSLVVGTVLTPSTGALSARAQPVIFGPAAYTQQGTLFFGTWTNTTRTPGVGTLSLTAAAPNLLLDTRQTPLMGTVAVSGVAGTAAQAALRTPSVGSVAAAGGAGALVQGTVQTPLAGSLTEAGVAGSNSLGLIGTVGALSLTGAAPGNPPASASVTPSVGELFFGRMGDVPRQPTTGTLTLTGSQASVLIQGVSSVTRTPLAAELFLGLGLTSPQLTAPTGALTLSGNVPTLKQSELSPSVGTVTLTGAAPIVQLGNPIITPGRGGLFLNGSAPSQAGGSAARTPTVGELAFGLPDNRIALVATGTLTLTGTVGNHPPNTDVSPGRGRLSLTLNPNSELTTGTGTLSFVGRQANPPNNTDLIPGVGTLRLVRGVEVGGTGLGIIGRTPLVQVAGTASNTSLTPGRAALFFTPFINLNGRGMVLSVGAVGLIGQAAITSQSNYDYRPLTGTLAMSGNAPAQPFTVPEGVLHEGCGSVSGTMTEGCGATSGAAVETVTVPTGTIGTFV